MFKSEIKFWIYFCKFKLLKNIDYYIKYRLKVIILVIFQFAYEIEIFKYNI